MVVAQAGVPAQMPSGEESESEAKTTDSEAPSAGDKSKSKSVPTKQAANSPGVKSGDVDKPSATADAEGTGGKRVAKRSAQEMIAAEPHERAPKVFKISKGKSSKAETRKLLDLMLWEPVNYARCMSLRPAKWFVNLACEPMPSGWPNELT